MYLIFALWRRALGKNEHSGKNFFLKKLEEKRNWFRIKDVLYSSSRKEGQVEMLWV